MFKKLTVLAIVFIIMSIFLPAANSAEPVITDSTVLEGVNTQIFNITLDGSKIVFNTFDQGIPEGDWFFVYSLQLVLLADLDGDFSTGYYMPISLSGGGQSGIPGIDAYIYIRITSNNTNITDALFYAEYTYRNGSYAGFTYANLPDSYHFMSLQDNKTLVIDVNWTAVKEEYMNRTGESLDLSPIIYIVPYGVTTRSYVVYQVNSQDNAAASSPISLPQANIVLDGSPQDWTSVNPALTDQFSNLGRWDTGSDIGSAYLAVNNTHLFVRIDHGGPIYMETDGPDIAKWYIIIRLDTNTDGIEDLTLLLEPNYARVWNKTAGIIRYLSLGNGYDYNNENTTMLEISIRMSQAQINLTQGQPVRILALSLSNFLTDILTSNVSYVYTGSNLGNVWITTGTPPITAGPVTLTGNGNFIANVTVYDGAVPYTDVYGKYGDTINVISVYYRVNDTAAVEWPIRLQTSFDYRPGSLTILFWDKANGMKQVHANSFSLSNKTLTVSNDLGDYIAGDPLITIIYSYPLVGGSTSGYTSLDNPLATVIVGFAALLLVLATIYRFKN